MARNRNANERADADNTPQTDETRERMGADTRDGRGWHGDPLGHAEAGRKGGEAVSRNREHMAEIGRKGGEAVLGKYGPRHMAEIGRKGGQTRTEGAAAENSPASREGGIRGGIKGGIKGSTEGGTEGSTEGGTGGITGRKPRGRSTDGRQSGDAKRSRSPRSHTDRRG